ncbi:arabinose transporter [Enterovirga sp. CN4-39]|uniref:arabinose transporter n=1 Tax=Enterovirga sp. CN4-39 TaxID=3400910 RepID=UPI003C00206A
MTGQPQAAVPASLGLSEPAQTSVVVALLPLKAAVLVAFLVIGLAFPVVPLHVRDGLGFGPVVVGVVAGCQFAASLIARIWSGHAADARGAKWAVVAGLIRATVLGLLYLSLLAFVGRPEVSVAVLLAGRALLGAAESFVITGATAWGLTRVGAANAGKVIAWMGTAMFAGFAAGAPLGSLLYAGGGFASVAAVTSVARLLTLALLWPLRGSVAAAVARPRIASVIGRIWLPGLGAALSSVGFGAILAFGSLLFVEHGWTPVWLAFSTYAIALMVARLLFGHLPDRLGGAKVAVGFVVVEAAGLATMWLAASGGLAAFGAALTGFGYSLVFPGLGLEAVRLAPPESRGVAMGAYTACLDLALGIAGPALGLVASGAGYSAVFEVSAIVVLCAALVSIPLLTKRAPRAQAT